VEFVNKMGLLNLPVDFRCRYSLSAGGQGAPRRYAPAESPIDPALPQDFEYASSNKHRTQKMRMHFLGVRAFRSNQQGAKKQQAFKIKIPVGIRLANQQGPC
jgi:hypothetical protein